MKGYGEQEFLGVGMSIEECDSVGWLGLASWMAHGFGHIVPSANKKGGYGSHV